MEKPGATVAKMGEIDLESSRDVENSFNLEKEWPV